MLDKENLVKNVSKYLVSTLIGAVVALVPFYYNTNSRLKAIETHSVTPEEAESLKISNAIILEKLNAIDDKISVEQAEREKMYHRNEKMYDLFMEKLDK